MKIYLTKIIDCIVCKYSKYQVFTITQHLKINNNSQSNKDAIEHYLFWSNFDFIFFSSVYYSKLNSLPSYVYKNLKIILMFFNHKQSEKRLTCSSANQLLNNFKIFIVLLLSLHTSYQMKKKNNNKMKNQNNLMVAKSTFQLLVFIRMSSSIRQQTTSTIKATAKHKTVKLLHQSQLFRQENK